jgi:hypothetical protein
LLSLLLKRLNCRPPNALPAKNRNPTNKPGLSRLV